MVDKHVRDFAMMLERKGDDPEVPPKPVPGPYASLALIAERLGEIGSLLAGANQIELKKLQAWRKRYENGT